MSSRGRAGPLMSLDEYLAFEERSPVRHEYVAGEVYAMSGVTTRHNLITQNISRRLHTAARAHGCRLFSDVVKLHTADRVYYPDVIVACGKAAEVESIVEAPLLLVEVTSPTTRAIDRREKLDSYRRIASLRMYLIVDERRRHVFVYAREANGEWTRDEIHGEGAIPIPVLETTLTMDDVYDDVALPPLAVEEEYEWADYAGEDGADRL